MTQMAESTARSRRPGRSTYKKQFDILWFARRSEMNRACGIGLTSTLLFRRLRVSSANILVAAQGVHGIDLSRPARGDISGHRCDEREERGQQGEDWRFDSNDAEHGAGNDVGQKE